MNFIKSLKETKVPKNHFALFWLGQASFLIKTARDKIIAIDPYLSDFVERTNPQEGISFKRLMPPVCEAKSLDIDILIITHEHGDHFDVDSITDLVRETTEVYTNSVVSQEMKKMGFNPKMIHLMRKRERINFDEFSLLPLDCDHGELSPEALGFILDFGFNKLYFSGDTALSLDRLTVPIEEKPEIVILPINGAFGNMDGKEAAEYAKLLSAKIAIPCHFWLFPLHGGSPQLFLENLADKAPDCEPFLFSLGEVAVF